MVLRKDVQLIKILSFIAIVSVSLFSCEEEKVLEVAKANYIEAKQNYEAKLDFCRTSEKALPSSLFSDIKLSKTDLENALLSMYTRTNMSCSKQARAVYLFESTRYLATAKHYNVTLNELDLRSADVVLENSWNVFKSECLFNDLDSQATTKLSKMPELQKPFDVFKTIENLHK